MFKFLRSLYLRKKLYDSLEITLEKSLYNMLGSPCKDKYQIDTKKMMIVYKNECKIAITKAYSRDMIPDFYVPLGCDDLGYPHIPSMEFPSYVKDAVTALVNVFINHPDIKVSTYMYCNNYIYLGTYKGKTLCAIEFSYDVQVPSLIKDNEMLLILNNILNS